MEDFDNDYVVGYNYFFDKLMVFLTPLVKEMRERGYNIYDIREFLEDAAFDIREESFVVQHPPSESST